MQKTPKNAEKANADGPTDQPTDRPTDIAGFRVACTQEPMKIESISLSFYCSVVAMK